VMPRGSSDPEQLASNAVRQAAATSRFCISIPLLKTFGG
jgi:hypothetical protein